jgi:hypothetical protein
MGAQRFHKIMVQEKASSFKITLMIILELASIQATIIYNLVEEL